MSCHGSDLAGHRPVAAVLLGMAGAGAEDAVNRAAREMQAKFRHGVIGKDQESGDTKIHVPDPDQCALDFDNEQREAYAALVAAHGINESQAEGHKPLKPPTPPKKDPAPEPTETSYGALAELIKEWDIVPSSVSDVQCVQQAVVSLLIRCCIELLYLVWFVA